MKVDKPRVPTVELPGDLKKELKVIAVQEGMTIKLFVEISVRFYLNHIKVQKAKA